MARVVGAACPPPRGLYEYRPMPKPTEYAREEFLKLVPNGTCVEFSQYDMMTGIDEDLKKIEGVCFELSRRWASCVLTDGDHFEPLRFHAEHYHMTKKELQEFIKLHNSRATVNSENFKVDGAVRDRLVTRRESGKSPAMFRHVVLRDREAILQQMWNNPGVYVYGFKGHGGGHAVGFEFKKDARIRFFDPNLGLYEIPGWSEKTLDLMRKFFKVVWELPWKSGAYKKLARRTILADKHRVLARFVLND